VTQKNIQIRKARGLGIRLKRFGKTQCFATRSAMASQSERFCDSRNNQISKARGLRIRLKRFTKTLLA
jgi:hypothetical protein